MAGLSDPAVRSAEELFIVDCLLPGQIRKLGRLLVYLTPRRPAKTSAQDCEIRGGEYVAYDQSNYATALKVWLPLAKQGDKDAQTYTGEIYEKGLGVGPDYTLAAGWYRKAAEQGHERAQINLGHLYEKGLGVKKDSETALNWYRKASGLKGTITLGPGGAGVKASKELQDLRQEVERRKRESETLREQLQRTQRQLERTRRELERRRGEIETERRKLGAARQKLERRKQEAQARNDAEIKGLEEQLKQREAELERQRQEVARLGQVEQHKGKLDAERARLETALQELERRKQEAEDRNYAEIKGLEKQLRLREGDLQHQRQQIARLGEMEQHKGKLDAERARLETALQELERRKQEAEDRNYAEIKGLEKQLRLREGDLQRQRQQIARLGEVEQRKGELETDREKLETALQELKRRKQEAEDRNYAEIKGLEKQLRLREGDLQRQRQETSRLRRELTRLEDEAERGRKQLAKLKKKEALLPGPRIEMIDPPLVTRGAMPRIKTRSGTERLLVGKVTAPAGLLTFAVNDREERVDNNGLFRVRIPVRRANIPVKVVAIDKLGKRAAVEFLLTPSLHAPESKAPPSAPAKQRKSKPLPTIEFGNYYALVIGNEKYVHWPRLKTPENDASKISNVLTELYGFKTKVLLNATRYDILRALNDFRKRLTERDNLLIYYAGHGYLDDKIGRGYWIPVDGEIDSNAKWISTFAITDILSVLSARHVLVVVDSCYAGALTRTALVRLEAGMSEEARHQWLKVMTSKRSRTVLTSGDLQPVLDGGGGGHSIFAKALLDVLGQNDEILEGRQLYKEISARVVYAAASVMTDQGPVEQIPVYAPARYAGHESGDFFFVPSTAK